MNQQPVILKPSHETRTFSEDSAFLAWCAKEHVLIKRYGPPWKLTKRVVGEIIGLPGTRGVLVSTNGIDCYIERSSLPLFYGHLAWFVQDKQDPDVQKLIKTARVSEGLDNMSQREFKQRQMLAMMEY